MNDHLRQSARRTKRKAVAMGGVAEKLNKSKVAEAAAMAKLVIAQEVTLAKVKLEPMAPMQVEKEAVSMPTPMLIPAPGSMQQVSADLEEGGVKGCSSGQADNEGDNQMEVSDKVQAATEKEQAAVASASRLID